MEPPSRNVTGRVGTGIQNHLSLTPCDRWALCLDAAKLGWTALGRCSECVSGSGADSNNSSPVSRLDPRSVGNAQFVTADEFNALLNQVSGETDSSNIS